MSETIQSIAEFNSTDRESSLVGFKVITDQQEIELSIDNYQGCCESWGWLLTEDDTEKFIGAKLLDIEATDTNRSQIEFTTGWEDETRYHPVDRDVRETVHLDAGGVMFIDIKTDRGSLQFVAYNCHNGYYGHSAQVKSRQLTHEVVV